MLGKIRGPRISVLLMLSQKAMVVFAKQNRFLVGFIVVLIELIDY